jgi:hypothetical protein
VKTKLFGLAGLAGVALVAYAYASSGSPSSSSGVFGRAVVGGPCPVSLEVELPCAERPLRATIAVTRVGSRRRAATLRSGGNGRFRTALPPGTYRLDPRPVGSAHARPMTIRVRPDRYVRITVGYRD